ncbi:TIGR03943 family protein [Cohnella lubricantis]|uniref:TIGR03943 family protein n=1 Tax=Cohnella lubricantis TaxID=2163172 RepID=A0A841TGI4_9BACL|nr:TIGR03943 family protein [Cohnella lubricantis]MBB6679039.1 TIGR03943 family protein [Cohnella lubricantis]MBP2120244.1 putative membrane protein [Cohnella lubricantis]
MIRYAILFGFAFMFFLLHYTGDINKYINTRYAYLSISAIVLLGLLSLYEFWRGYKQELAAEKRAAAAKQALEQGAEPGELVEVGGHDSNGHAHHDHDHAHHNHEHAHQDHDHAHPHGRDHAHELFGHTHEPSSKWKRYAGYAILLFPILTGIFLPVKTLDSSFVAAKGFSFPTLEEEVKNSPGNHQFLRPNTSLYYSQEDYDKIKNKEMEEFVQLPEIDLNDDNYLKGMEAVYNYPNSFIGKTIQFDGFAYKGQQVDGRHYFVFRFGFIHCIADSGVFGMLVEFPKDTVLNNDDWLHVKGELTWEYYQPLKATIPVLKADAYEPIEAPEDPYVYRNFN